MKRRHYGKLIKGSKVLKGFADVDTLKKPFTGSYIAAQKSRSEGVMPEFTDILITDLVQVVRGKNTKRLANRNKVYLEVIHVKANERLAACT